MEEAIRIARAVIAWGNENKGVGIVAGLLFASAGRWAWSEWHSRSKRIGVMKSISFSNGPLWGHIPNTPWWGIRCARVEFKTNAGADPSALVYCRSRIEFSRWPDGPILVEVDGH